ncbi:hypothetical protein BOX15_Mlig026079g2 [Macrostomum lignano]|uniref:Conserved oligomeric Golgi complex subunit 1 n=2 Tax=Macrostomum lignano TaxID=282301 RepID=A0A267EE78_9PLAT|nr:hypothetical protein BOX15_Mlig026079g2 [Macrostomum lignano]
MDVLNLFEENKVEQVRAIEKRTRNEIERKKEELRFLVGERYRELIVAADVIKTMSGSAQEINDSLAQLSAHRTRLQRERRHLQAFARRRHGDGVGVGQEAVDPRFELRVRRSQIGAQIRLLLDTPELVYSSLESQSCLSAAQLFFIASHVHTHLELNPDLEEAGLKAEALLRWSDVGQLKKPVVARCRELLAQPITFSAGSLCDRSQAFAQHLAALMLLNGLGIEAVIADFFSLRSQSIELTFRDMETETSKAQFLLVATNLLSSVEICHTLFSSSAQFESGLLQRIVQEKLQVNARLVLASFDSAQVGTRHLPEYVLAYQPMQNLEDCDLTVRGLKAAADEWLERTREFLNYQLVEALNFVSDLASLYSIRCALLAQFKEVNASPDWATCCSAVFERRLDLWSEIFQPVFHTKLTSLCKSALDSLYNSWSDGLDQLLADIRAGAGQQADSDSGRRGRIHAELDPAAFLWSDSAKETVANRLALLTPRLQALCDACRTTVRGLFASIESAQMADGGGGSEDGLAAVRGLLDDFIGRCAGRLESLGSQEAAAESSSEHCLLAMQRLAVAMATLLPSLATASTQTGGGGHLRRQAAKADPRLRDVAESLARAYLDGLCTRHVSRFESAIAEEVLGSSMAFLAGSARWDRRTAAADSSSSSDASADPAATAAASAMVPVCASRPCHRLLLGLSRDLGRRGGHALSRASLQHLLASLTDRLLAIVDRCLTARLSGAAAESGPVQQQQLAPNQLAQLLFDLRFLFALLSRREDSPANAEFNRQLEALIGRVESAIDPFDLEALAGPLTQSAVRHAHACSSLYGLLASIDRLGAFAAHRVSPGSAAAYSAQSQDPAGPSVLPAATVQSKQLPRFGLLPVSAKPLVEAAASSAAAHQSGGKKQPQKQQQQQQTLKSVHTVPANLSSVRESPSFYNKFNSILFKS